MHGNAWRVRQDAIDGAASYRPPSMRSVGPAPFPTVKGISVRSTMQLTVGPTAPLRSPHPAARKAPPPNVKQPKCPRTVKGISVSSTMQLTVGITVTVERWGTPSNDSSLGRKGWVGGRGFGHGRRAAWGGGGQSSGDAGAPPASGDKSASSVLPSQLQKKKQVSLPIPRGSRAPHLKGTSNSRFRSGSSRSHISCGGGGERCKREGARRRA